MAPENAEIVRQGWKVFRAEGPRATFDRFYSEDCVVEDFPEFPDGATYTGREGALRRNSNFVAGWEEVSYEPTEFVDLADDTVLAVIAIRGRGKGSGALIDGQAAFVYELRDGKIVRDRAFRTKEQALAAIGDLG